MQPNSGAAAPADAQLAAPHGRNNRAAHPAGASQIGPNAIIQLGIALTQLRGGSICEAVFLRAGLAHYLAAPPPGMVDEAEVMALHASLRSMLPHADVQEVSWVAGTLTGDYILANRIPKPAQVALRLLPRTLATRMLLSAISRHAWTFAGSGEFSARAGPPTRFEIRNSPLCRGVAGPGPHCAFYAGAFTRLLQYLVDPHLTVQEIQCAGAGADVCIFEACAGHPAAGART